MYRAASRWAGRPSLGRAVDGRGTSAPGHLPVWTKGIEKGGVMKRLATMKGRAILGGAHSK